MFAPFRKATFSRVLRFHISARSSSAATGIKIAIEGNIAAGKSTLIKMLEAKCHDWHIIPEPVSKWTNINCSDDEASLGVSHQNGGNLLKLYYDDVNRWSYTFQSYAFFSRLRLQRMSLPEKFHGVENAVQILERSLQSDRYIFALNCYESGLMSEIEWNLYQDWTSYLLQTLGELKLAGIIYLRAEPQVCYSRLQKRGRNEEKDITLDYLRCLHEKHDAWLYSNTVKMHDTLTGVPVMVLDCNEDFNDNSVNAERIIEEVVQFVHQQKHMRSSMT